MSGWFVLADELSLRDFQFSCFCMVLNMIVPEKNWSPYVSCCHPRRGKDFFEFNVEFGYQILWDRRLSLERNFYFPLKTKGKEKLVKCQLTTHL